MGDLDDAQHDPVIENLIDHPELTSSCRVSPFELSAKWLTDLVGIFGQWAANELPARGCDRFWKSLGERPSGSTGQLDAICHLGSRPAARISSLTSSMV